LTRDNSNCLQYRRLLCLDFAGCKDGGKCGCEYGLKGDAECEDGRSSTLRDEKIALLDRSYSY
jgi:hypothetical protein